MSFTPRTPVNENPDRAAYRRSFVTRHQVTGWRFAMRRIASGLALRDTRMLTDPLRAQSRSVLMGILIVITGLIGCFLFSLIRPNGSVGENSVVADRDSSALYVRVDDQLHPVLNLASARLIVGKAVQPKAVGGSGLDQLPRGVTVGIPGAPERMMQNNSRDADWIVCDSTGAADPGVTVLAGPPATGGERASTLPPDRAVLVASGPPEAPLTWLLWGGRRSVIDLADHAVTDALGFGGQTPVARPIAQGLFNAIPEGTPLRAPVIAGAGSPPQFPLSVPASVGAVVAAYGTDSAMMYYAVLPDGLQQVSPVLAALLRNTNSYGLQQPPRLGVDEIARTPVSRILDTAAFPDQRIGLVDAASSPVTCVRWTKPADAGTSSLALLSGAAVPIADGVRPVDLPGPADGATAARVAVPTGKGYLVQTVAQEQTAPPTGSSFWISDTGMRFGIDAANPDELATTIAALGLTPPAMPVPWSMLTLFSAGPALSKAGALTAYVGTETR
ncbi:type VII secretion protein EccB [Candidatus Mycolicibacterium alkanivorans]|uniref:Type VII secretion protein EccB n=1 Tax=Candidatus Mycolicibacterium alkanivorans TaxID=2954114 RepID=A0ABS9YZK2_9MYCO|nr:type VII secretion protein EccB [Candidatus Mycolicibacterium alkanivorans]MCI4676655.1 type VII secretion protein EccB [Candidatus Mycolicibacterium alkanivorans]